MVWVRSCRGKNWYWNASSNSFQCLKQTSPVFDACVNTHKVNVAALPIFMKDKVHRICTWSSENSFTHSPKYRVHELKNMHPFAQLPSYSEGIIGLAKRLQAVLVSPKAAPGRSTTRPSITIIRFSNLLSRFCFSCLSLTSSCSMACRHSANSSSNSKDMWLMQGEVWEKGLWQLLLLKVVWFEVEWVFNQFSRERVFFC